MTTKPKPKPPAWLTDKDALTQWKNLAPEFFEAEEATTALRERFARYCDTVAKWHIARKFIDQNGFEFAVYEPLRQGEPPDAERVIKSMVSFPEVGIYRQLSETIAKLERDLGITPE